VENAGKTTSVLVYEVDGRTVMGEFLIDHPTLEEIEGMISPDSCAPSR
jgi:hypothetical protein